MTAEACVDDAARARAALRVAAEARRWIGTPFAHGASCCGGGCDCVGLLRGVWRAVVGPEVWRVPPYSSDWAEAGLGCALHAGLSANLIAVQGRAERPAGAALAADGTGSVLLFRLRPREAGRHVGLRTGAASFVHAYGRHGVVESALTPAWAGRIVAVFALPVRASMD